MALKYSPFEILIALLALSQGMTAQEVAQRTRTTAKTVNQWRNLYPRDTERIWALLRYIDKKGKVPGDAYEWAEKVKNAEGFPWPMNLPKEKRRKP